MPRSRSTSSPQTSAVFRPRTGGGPSSMRRRTASVFSSGVLAGVWMGTAPTAQRSFPLSAGLMLRLQISNPIRNLRAILTPHNLPVRRPKIAAASRAVPRVASVWQQMKRLFSHA